MKNCEKFQNEDVKATVFELNYPSSYDLKNSFAECYPEILWKYFYFNIVKHYLNKDNIFFFLNIIYTENDHNVLRILFIRNLYFTLEKLLFKC